MLKVATLWLENEQRELLLARRADHKATDPGLWGPSVTGKVEPGETFEQAVVREAHEELALEPLMYTPRFLLKTEFAHPDGQTWQFKIYATKVPERIIDDLHIDTNEVAEIKWYTSQEIKELLHSKPGEVVVASAFVFWSRIFKALGK